MVSPSRPSTELAVRLRLTAEATQRLAERAARAGQDLAEVASAIIEDAVTKPSVDELLAPYRHQVAESGMSDEELDEFHERLRDKVWEERQGRAR